MPHNSSRKIWVIFSSLTLILMVVVFFYFRFTRRPKIKKPTGAISANLLKSSEKNPTHANIANKQNFSPEIIVGPRQNIPVGTPSDYGFWSFSVPVTGILSRSGQPTIKDFQWLKAHGWKSDIDLRIDGDHNEVSDDAKIPGFSSLGLNYLKIQMLDGAAPTDVQAETFLDFVTNPANEPAEVHCRGGIGRAGIMVALYRYSVQGWPIEKILEESKLYSGGIDAGQINWLKKWAASHPPMQYAR